MDKVAPGEDVRDRVDHALDGVTDGAVVMVGGFGAPGQPIELLDGLRRRRLRNLTVVSNNAGTGDQGLAALLADGAVCKIVCSYPRQRHSHVFDSLFRSARIQLELVPQGTLVERIRAAAAGVGGFYTRTGVGTTLAEGKEVRQLDGHDHLLELPLPADVALVRAHRGDRWGNLVFRGTGANFAPVMAAAAARTVAQVEQVAPLGTLDPHVIDVPNVYVQHVVLVPDPAYVDKD